MTKLSLSNSLIPMRRHEQETSRVSLDSTNQYAHPIGQKMKVILIALTDKHCDFLLCFLFQNNAAEIIVF